MVFNLSFSSLTLLIATASVAFADIIAGAQSSVKVSVQSCNNLESHLEPGYNVRAFAFPQQYEFNDPALFYTGYADNNEVTASGSSTGSLYYSFQSAESSSATTSAFNMEFNYEATILEFTGYFKAPTSGLYTFSIESVSQGAALFLGESSLLNCCSNPNFNDASSKSKPYLLAAVVDGVQSVNIAQLIYLEEGYYPVRLVTENSEGDSFAQITVLLPDQNVYGKFDDLGDHLYRLDMSNGGCASASTLSQTKIFTLTSVDIESISTSCSELDTAHTVCYAYSPLPTFATFTSYTGAETSIDESATLSSSTKPGSYTQYFSILTVSVPYTTSTITAKGDASTASPVVGSTVNNSDNSTYSFWEVTVYSPDYVSTLERVVTVDKTETNIVTHTTYLPLPSEFSSGITDTASSSTSASTTTRTVVPTYLVPANNVRESTSTASITAWAQLESLTAEKTSSSTASSVASVSTSVHDTNSVVSVGSNTLPVTYGSYSQNPTTSSASGQVSFSYKSAITTSSTTQSAVFSQLVAHKAVIHGSASSDSTTVSSPATSSTIFGAGVDRAAGAASVSVSASESISSVPTISSVSDSSAERSLQITGIFGALISFLVFIF
ncbi:unnamed protein product [Ambrosiozyma monospora]|uniref:Unnamed protein product n=1 Tax=Ambrosiozyma monospora TaxID=43982 RepID=A0ACB5T3D7_AMBMO|nr:unnamed protein product [Ambrosiozyma monospora]